MSKIMKQFVAYCACVVAIYVAAGGFASAQDLSKRATWQTPTPDEVRTEILGWVEKQQDIDELTRVKIDALWPEAMPAMTGNDLLEQVTATFALVDSQADELVQFCRGQRTRFVPPEFAVLQDESTPELMRNNLSLLLGRWLAQQQLYDETAQVLDGIEPKDVVDPASLLFFQSVAYHRTLDKERGLPVISTLLENEDAIPRRYASVAKLMEADLKPLKEDSLDEIARLMDAIRIELEHARAGKRVRDRQQEVIAKLEKLIDDLEKQRQQQQNSASNSNAPPSKPADDSQAMGGKGTGKVPPRKLESEADWGNLPPKQREEALQQISKEFPSHFREVIEEYFRKLARDEADR